MAEQGDMEQPRAEHERAQSCILEIGATIGATMCLQSSLDLSGSSPGFWERFVPRYPQLQPTMAG